MARITLGIVPIADKAVAVAGVREPLTAVQQLVTQVAIQWHPANADDIYLGDSTVAAGAGVILNASNPVIVLTAEDSFADEDRCVIDLNTIYIDAVASGDKVKLIYLAQTDKAYNS